MLPLLIAGLSGLNSCREGAKKKEQKKIELQDVDTLRQQIGKNVYPLPTSAEVIKML